jgi:hypothetical protein
MLENLRMARFISTFSIGNQATAICWQKILTNSQFCQNRDFSIKQFPAGIIINQ